MSSEIATSTDIDPSRKMRFRRNRGDVLNQNVFAITYDKSETMLLERSRRMRGMRGMGVSREKLATSSGRRNESYEILKSNNKLDTPSLSSSLPPTSKEIIAPFVDTTYEVDAGNINHGTLDDNFQQHEQQQIHSMKNVIIAGILIALIIVLTMNFIFLVYEPVARFLRRKFRRFASENKSMIERRYRTIDKWLIQKTVQHHDSICRNIQNYSRLPNGESSLGRHTSRFIDESKNMTSCTPLCLTTSFDTNTTDDSSSTCSSTTTSSSSTSTSSDTPSSINEKNGSDTPNYDMKMIDKSIFKTDERIEIIGRTLPGQFDSGPCTQQLSTTTNTKMPPDDDDDDDDAVLTREQVLDKMEIAKSKSEILASGSHGCGAHSEDGEYQGQECNICMEAFKVGDVISFSPAEGCYHVFHHNCLRRWLLRKTDCPCCRVTMLPIDRPKPKECDEQSNDEESPPTNTQRQRHHRSRRSFFHSGSSQTDRPWYHKNASVRNERMNKKCGTYYCVACGVVELKTHLRQDLLNTTKTTKKPRSDKN